MGAGTSPTRVDALRGDSIAWLDAPPPAYAALLAAVATTLREDAWLHVSPLETQLARYPEGARYARHLDTFRTGTRTPRRVTLITYLNADWREADAGALRAWEPDGPRDVLPLLGRAVLFLSERLPHEVLPATRERWAVTTWYG
jgi:SM-20-related protein